MRTLLTSRVMVAVVTLGSAPIPILGAIQPPAPSFMPVTVLVHSILFGGLLGGMLWVAWFIIGILLAIWAYRDAGSRGTSGLLWAIIVVILPILGIIIYLVIRPSGRASSCGGRLPPGSAPPPEGPQSQSPSPQDAPRR